MSEDHTVIDSYDVVEEEEEFFTIDFNTGQAYQKEETLMVKEEETITTKEGKSFPTKEEMAKLNESIVPAPELEEDKEDLPEIKAAKEEVIKEDPFKEEMSNLLIDQIVSKGLGSLLQKNQNLEIHFDKLMEEQRMGDLSAKISHDLQQATDIPRHELRAAFVGGTVRYDRVPSWAKSYLRDYVKNMVSDLSVLVSDEG